MSSLNLSAVQKHVFTIQNESESNLKSLEASDESLSNDLISLKVDNNTGAILKLSSETINNGQNLLSGNFSNLTYGFLDIDHVGSHAWNLLPEYWKHPKVLPNDKDVKIKISEKGPIFTTLLIKRKLGRNPVIQKISLFKDCPEVFLEYLADWQQRNIMTKILYNTATSAEIVTADMAYCALESKTNPETPCDKARYEKICQKYFDLSTPDKKWGIAMLNEGKYAFDVKGGDMRLTLLRCCKYPIPAVEAWVNEERKINIQNYQHRVPRHSELGPFKCNYALLPHIGGALINSEGEPNSIVKRKAEEFNNPILIIPTKGYKEDRLSSEPLFEILTSNIYIGTLKRKEWDNSNAIIVRIIEFTGIISNAKVKINPELTKKITDIKAIDLLERETNLRFKWNKENNVLEFKIQKFEICTFEIIIGE